MGKQESMSKMLSRSIAKKSSTSKLSSNSSLLVGSRGSGDMFPRPNSVTQTVGGRKILAHSSGSSSMRGRISHSQLRLSRNPSGLAVGSMSGMNHANTPSPMLVSKSTGEDTTPKAPTRDSTPTPDMPPQIPRRCSSILGVQDAPEERTSPRTASLRNNSSDYGSGVSSQKNAVFGHFASSSQQQSSPFWNQTPTTVDKPPNNSRPALSRANSDNMPPGMRRPTTESDKPPRMTTRYESVSALNSFANIRLKSVKSLAGLHHGELQVSAASSQEATSSPPNVFLDQQRMALSQAMHSSLSSSPTSVMPEDTVEVGKGIRVRLRGAQETWEQIQRDFYLPISCTSCSTELCIIKDADYVQCPMCKAVGSTEGVSDNRGGGAGIGFTLDDLRRWETGKQGEATPV